MASLVSESSLRATTALNIILGIWLFFSPWVYKAGSNPDSWNNWIFGVLVVIFAATRYSSPETGRALSVLNLLIGIWTFVSPWVFGYTGNSGRFANSLIVGAVIFILGVYGAGSIAVHREHRPEAHL
jgi:hypothetical protein